MTDLQKGVLVLLQAGLTGKAGQLPEGFSLDAAFETIKSHQVVGLCYEGAVLCGVDKELPVMQRMFAISYKQLAYSEMQDRALKKLFAAFEENGLEYLPLKGTVIKKLYPRPELRIMADADVLIRMDQYETIRRIMQEQGYEEKDATGHELPWRSAKLYIELHSRLVEELHKGPAAYFGVGWERGIREDGCRFTFKPEDHYIYMLAHSAKHFRNGGIGIRQMMDLWVWQQAYPQLDMAYIAAEAKKLELSDYLKNIIGMLDGWFNGGVLDAQGQFLTDFIFDGGSWGTWKRNRSAIALRESRASGSYGKARFKQILEIIFPDYSWMCKRYKILKRVPVLLPIMWIARWFGTILFRSDFISKRRSELENSSREDVLEYEEAVKIIGVDRFE